MAAYDCTGKHGDIEPELQGDGERLGDRDRRPGDLFGFGEGVLSVNKSLIASPNGWTRPDVTDVASFSMLSGVVKMMLAIDRFVGLELGSRGCCLSELTICVLGLGLGVDASWLSGFLCGGVSKTCSGWNRLLSLIGLSADLGGLDVFCCVFCFR
jgi:hypothetical protein